MYSKASKKILYFACMARRYRGVCIGTWAAVPLPLTLTLYVCVNTIHSKRAAALSSSAADVDLTDSDDSDADGDEDEGDDSRTPRASQADKDDDGFFDWYAPSFWPPKATATATALLQCLSPQPLCHDHAHATGMTLTCSRWTTLLAF